MDDWCGSGLHPRLGPCARSAPHPGHLRSTAPCSRPGFDQTASSKGGPSARQGNARQGKGKATACMGARGGRVSSRLSSTAPLLRTHTHTRTHTQPCAQRTPHPGHRLLLHRRRACGRPRRWSARAEHGASNPTYHRPNAQRAPRMKSCARPDLNAANVTPPSSAASRASCSSRDPMPSSSTGTPSVRFFGAIAGGALLRAAWQTSLSGSRLVKIKRSVDRHFSICTRRTPRCPARRHSRRRRHGGAARPRRGAVGPAPRADGAARPACGPPGLGRAAAAGEAPRHGCCVAPPLPAHAAWSPCCPGGQGPRSGARGGAPGVGRAAQAGGGEPCQGWAMPGTASRHRLQKHPPPLHPPAPTHSPPPEHAPGRAQWPATPTHGAACPLPPAAAGLRPRAPGAPAPLTPLACRCRPPCCWAPLLTASSAYGRRGLHRVPPYPRRRCCPSCCLASSPAES